MNTSTRKVGLQRVATPGTSKQWCRRSAFRPVTARKPIVVVAAATKRLQDGEAQICRRALLLSVPSSFVLLGAAADQAKALTSIMPTDQTHTKGFFERIDQQFGRGDFRTERQTFEAVPPTEAKKRLLASADKIKKTLPSLIANKKWSAAYQELRQASGTVRYDLDKLTAQLPTKAARKSALAAQEDAMKAIEKLDYSIWRAKDTDAANRWHGEAVKKLETAVTSVAA